MAKDNECSEKAWNQGFVLTLTLRLVSMTYILPLLMSVPRAQGRRSFSMNLIKTFAPFDHIKPSDNHLVLFHTCPFIPSSTPLRHFPPVLTSNHIDYSSCHSARPFPNWRASVQVLLLSILRAAVENPKPRIVHFWRKVNEGLQVQEENA